MKNTAQKSTTNATEDDPAKKPQSALTLHIFLSHLIAIGTFWFTDAFLSDLTGWSEATILVLAVLIGVGVGFLFDISLFLGIGLVESALRQLAAGQIIDPPLIRPWPLGRLLAVVDELSGHGYQVSEMRGSLSEKMQAAAAQEERNRLARELHDSIKQQIFSISVSAAAVEARWDSDPVGAQAALADVRRGAKEAMVEMNAMLQQLRPAPLEKVGLTEALREQCEALGYRTGATVKYDLKELPPDDHLPVGTQEVIFRVTQEALTNIARHARASEVLVRLGVYKKAQKEFLFLEVKDNGRGFDEQTVGSGMGLNNIRQRAQSIGGRTEIKSRPGYGTAVRVIEIPVTPPVPAMTPSTILNQYSPAERAIISDMATPGMSLFLKVKMPGCFVIGLFILISLPLLFFYSGTAVALYTALVGAVCLYANGKKILESRAEAKMAHKSGEIMQAVWARRRQHLWQAIFMAQIMFWLPIQFITWLPRVGIEQFQLLSTILMFSMGVGIFYQFIQMMKLDHMLFKLLPVPLQSPKIPKPFLIAFMPIAGTFYLLTLVPDNGFVAMTVREWLLVSVYLLLVIIYVHNTMRNGLLWYWKWRLFPQKSEQV